MKIFLSHSSADESLAQFVADSLRENCFDVRTHGLLAVGSAWFEETLSALRECDAMVVLLTPNSLHSEHIQHEISYALGNLNYRNKVVSLILSDAHIAEADIPWVLKRLKMIPLALNDSGAIREVAETLRGAA